MAAAVSLLVLPSSGFTGSPYATAAWATAEGWPTTGGPPASLWVTGLVVRMLGLSTWSLLPQAVASVLAVRLRVTTVRRRTGPVVALLAGTGLALLPVAPWRRGR